VVPPEAGPRLCREGGSQPQDHSAAGRKLGRGRGDIASPSRPHARTLTASCRLARRLWNFTKFIAPCGLATENMGVRARGR
jgi:hypothetical protein